MQAYLHLFFIKRRLERVAVSSSNKDAVRDNIAATFKPWFLCAVTDQVVHLSYGTETEMES